jgi:hypothetical protein
MLNICNSVHFRTIDDANEVVAGAARPVIERGRRACDTPAHGDDDSVILRRRQEAGGTGAAKP